MEYVNAFIEFAKALAWPICAGGIAYYYRDHIIAMLPRVTKIGPVSLDGQTQKSLPASTPVNDENLERLRAMMPPDLLIEARAIVEAKITRDHAGQKINEVEYLTTMSATLMLAGLFERTYGAIFGSQIALLSQVNSSPITPDRAKEIYSIAAAAFPLVYENYSFEQWLHFMESFVLISRAEDGAIVITLRGRGFLRFCIENGYSLNRPN
jgi:hypothetical protein